MRPSSKSVLLTVFIVSIFSCFAAAQSASYVLTNDDTQSNSVTVFRAGLNQSGVPQLTKVAKLPTTGAGHGGGYFAAVGITVLDTQQQKCAFVADADSADVSSFNISTKTLVGKFKGSNLDNGGLKGMSLAMSDQYVYASYMGSYTMATYQIQSGCKLHFLGDIDVVGQAFGAAAGLAIHGNMMVVAYSDSTIESFDISGGIPVSNGDRQLSTGSKDGNVPSGVVITKDGHYAIFGDAAGATTVEVSDISSGKLTPTLVYFLGDAISATVIHMSPDESMFYVSNVGSGQVTAAFFDKTTGIPSQGCTSPVLKGFGNNWFYPANLLTATGSGTGKVLFVAEDGPTSGIGILQLKAGNGKCQLTELPTSPALDPNSQSLRFLANYPPL